MNAAEKSARVHSPTIQQLADMAGVSKRLICQALKVHRDGCDALHTAVQQDTVSLRLANEIARFDHASQALILRELPTMPRREHAGFVALLYGNWRFEQREANHA